jgi:transposase-like protein
MAVRIVEGLMEDMPIPTPAEIAHNNAVAQELLNVPKCPTCGSTNISKIGTLNRMASVGFFGLASSKIGKTQKCNNCGYTW